MSLPNRCSLEVRLHKAYGMERFYPNNSFANTLCKLMQKKSMTRKDLETCKKAGWEVLVALNPIKLDPI